MHPTGRFSDHFVEDIPAPKVEVHRYRRHVCRCQTCGATAQGRSDLAAPGAHVGERAKLVTDFYAACHALECRKQRCLVHLLRELVKLR
ncbi:MAG: hypothetical protein AB7Q45_18810, partial [Planctomycetaceae bacterium]